MAEDRPFKTVEDLHDAAEKIWQHLSPDDWKEAFSHHPKIGEVQGLKKKFSSTSQWAQSEQGGVAVAEESVLQELAEGNRRYEEKFGYIFIVCATGKRADEMLALLRTRLHNDPAEEVVVAAGEQMKITRIRIEKMLEEG